MSENSQRELMHYGVIGMKWGIRRGKTDKVYAKASKKLKKLDDKFEKRSAKYEKKAAKADRKLYGLSTRSSRARAVGKARRASFRMTKRAVKAQRWLSKMEKTFAKTDALSISPEQRALGEKYTKRIKTMQARHYEKY